ncbi:subclass B1 metallo-beta-lactamase [Cellulophaga baltica]|uniref:subclass B1 metallo-beta-lactamase n=1 Tax=Cellulophaga baltica TaxID=76594 RepID=UPI0024958F85|nr:subclass B1 metallo-beta-lactamase [Cellulophaga baltica]
MKNTRLVILSLLLLFITGCKSPKNTVAYSSDTLKLIPLSNNTFQHITYLNTNDYGKVACNGLVVIHNNEAIIFDTPTSNAVSTELIRWITEIKKSSIKAIVVNHFHEDCLGGLTAFHDIDIPSYGNTQTLALSKEKNLVTPKYGFDSEITLKVGELEVMNRHFGEAHTADNIVSYIPSEALLFGGCMVKSLNATKGFTGDANLEEWSNTIQKIKEEYPDLKLIIPGHGNAGGQELLDYTIELFK